MEKGKGSRRQGSRRPEKAAGRGSQEKQAAEHDGRGIIDSSGISTAEEVVRKLEADLTLVATPLGNLGDISPRCSEALRLADFWIVEDTRISAKLAFHLGVKKPLKVAHDHSQDVQLNRLLDEIELGQRAVLLTDGGAPGVSDPGARIVDLAYERGLTVDGIPGPSAVINALMLSGFFAQRFAFLGFLGRTPGDIKKELVPFLDSPYTLVIFESPHRFRKLIEVAGEVLGERRYAICREITKRNQQVFRSDLPIIPNEGEVPAKGEFTIVIEGRRKTLGRQKYVKI